MGVTLGGVEAHPEATLLTDRAARFLEKGPADVVDLIGHICNLPGAPRIVAEHMAQAMFSGRPEFVLDPLGRWTLTVLPQVIEAGGGDRTRSVRESGFGHYSAQRRYQRNKSHLGMVPPQPLAGMSYVVVDVETTGGSWPADRITEIAAVVVRDGQVTEMFETLVNPERSIPPMVSRITKITWDMVKDAPVFSLVAPRLMKALEGNVFVAHNAQFDWKFVSRELSRASGIHLMGRRLCTVRMARSLLPQLPRRSLDYVANYYGVEITRRHRAGGDALATAHCLIRLLDDAGRLGCTTWQDLDCLLSRRAARKKKRRSALPSPVSKDTTA
ncbi:MAG TPA: 3'-5' exonuclease [Gemmatimonadaceae bacterium]|nr:3'-5' exonuclease [Gemmatimonadaceae bacterium]